MRCVVVDHGLQDGSAEVARRAADVARGFGLEAEVVRVEVGEGNLEAAARSARYEALLAYGSDVWVGHTADDQAEQVLLGLARGSGTRTLAGIPARGTLPGGAAVVRPLLGLTRADTETICRWAGLTWFEDPHNRDPALLRSRVRTRVLPALEVADRVVICRDGRTVDAADPAAFTGDGAALDHPYTRALWQALPGNGFRVAEGV